MRHRPVAHGRSGTERVRQARVLRRIATGVAMLFAVETALVSQGTGLAFATDTAEHVKSSPVKPTSGATKASGPAEAQDEASAVLMARLQHRKIEVLSARTADSSTYALPDGQMQTQAYAGPVRTKVGGVWKNIDTSLSDTGSDLTPAAAPADVAVSDGGDTRLASVSKGKRSFGLGWAVKLPTPSVKANTASYALGGGQTLSVSALAQGFSENIRLARKPADGAVTYRIPVNLAGLKLSRAASGHLLLKDTTGTLVAEAPAPVMWDASLDRASGESAHQEQVATRVETAADGSQSLVLTPDTSFLATATYPVTVDPTTTLAVTTDTWVQNPDYPDSQVSSEELKSGTYDGGTDTARSYLKFDVSKFVGKHITAANLSLYNYYSATCGTSGPATLAKRVTSTWTSSAITWGAQPTTTTTGDASNTGHWGYDSSCAANWSNWNLQAITQAWADGSTNQGVQIASASETDSTTWRRFRSANYSTSGYAPKLSVTYNSYATTSSSAISPNYPNPYNGKTYVTSLTPTLSTKVTDADGGVAQGQYEITADPAYADNTYTYTAYGHTVASGSVSTLAIPAASAFPAGAHLRFRVRAYDGTDYGTWSAYKTFVMNTALPAAPTVSCTPYTANTWTATATGGATCTLDTTSTDGLGFAWGLDDSTIPKRVYDTTDGSGGDPLTITIAPGEDWHKLYAKTIDSGGNMSSATTTYAFGVGDGAGLLTPGDGDSAARRVSLTSTGKSTYTGVTYQYRRGETDTWHSVPVADVTKSADGSAVSAWPVTVTGGSPAALTWNVTTSLTEDGALDIRAAFTDGTTTAYSQPHTITVDRNAGTAPSADIGPGTVNTLTGDFTLSDTDASAFGLTVSRTASSRRPTAGADAEGQVAIFGPQWTSGTTAELTDSDWAYVRKTSATSVALVDVDGDETGFTATSAGGWKPEPGSEDLTLTGSLTGSFTLKDDDGTTTTFAKVDPAATTWQVATTYLPTDNTTTKVVSEKVTSGTSTLARPKYVIAPTSAVSSSTCGTTPATAGCRLLEFVYATSTTATGSALGDYTGQVSQIKLWATSPGASAATATVVAQYSYDNTGHLREQWDPRISPALKTAYTYDSSGHVTTLTPPGELPWTFTYGQAGNAATAGTGMLLSASRPNLTAGSKSTTDGTTATTSVVYDVPLSGTNAPYALGTSDVAAWGQTDVPTDATAVFPADSVPSSHTGGALAATSYTRATITYTDNSGREVDTATPGGHISTTEYDRFGNSVRELTAGNRELALATSGAGQAEQVALSIDQLTSADRAEQLSTRSVYSSDGLRETDEYGPLHQVTLTSTLAAGSGGTDLAPGSQVPAREHTVNTYDEGRPTDGTATVANQVTTAKVGAYVAGYPADADVRTTASGYDWVKGLPTSTVTDPSGLALTKNTSYDSQGRVIKSTLPKSSGSDAGATVTTYYSATGTGACNGRPEWADLLCSTGPGGAITGGGSNPTQLPTRTIEYDRWGNTAKTTETANSVTRTTTNTYDAAGRLTQTVVSGGVGTAVPDVTTTYDPDNGKVATVASGAGTVTHSYDQLGREISYSDGAGNTTATAYDALGRPVKTTDSAPSTTTYTYDTSKDPRGLETSRTDSVAGAFAATYDADGDLATESLPGGYTLTVAQDETGAQTSRVYTKDSDGTVVASDTVDQSVQGQTVTDNDTTGQTRSRGYTYDAAGRLTRADDTDPNGACTRRDYTFDKNSNRTALAVVTSDVGTACTSTGATGTSYSYDSADRLEATGTVYDAFGRTTTQASGATIGYYANDLVRQQTSGTSRQTWNLDAAGRLASWTTETQGTDGTWTQTGARTDHYGADGDSPDWTQETVSTVTRNVPAADGDLAAVTSATGDTVLQLTDIHGDVTVQLPLDTSQSVTAAAYDEFGNPEDGTAATRYGWLGGDQRASDTVTGATLMGVRLYDPTAGRFLQVDPVPGGSANAYDYVNQDPVNGTDLDGRCFWDGCVMEGYGVYLLGAAAVGGAYYLYRHPVHLHFSWHWSWHWSWHIHLFAHKKKKQSTGKSHLGRHQAGERRYSNDRGGEKGDARRRGNPNKRRKK
ncbi:DNRLRE domain-containing protein [Streptomyces turgidiscabies]|uniref:RHS repeat-associated core domain protein n=1 Tax=Streptomyces turgidiscabies (strain Car8) TaxID=698760 RepID=L7EWI1_STRT8|nr:MULTISPECIES: DNRLRE domain-containing protein [Streptomyces]ELP62745.1 RHS repeat-associated core domain protein [Streptomyces turgidiscabies Car8]MDX3494466.1 DNRLRE domain-containing protein [Streptomyces turgidiscabies]GAQ74747.1 tRNA3(Ser-specific nuclease WapA precursor [Streptomyces turgidiscabies]